MLLNLKETGEQELETICCPCPKDPAFQLCGKSHVMELEEHHVTSTELWWLEGSAVAVLRRQRLPRRVQLSAEHGKSSLSSWQNGAYARGVRHCYSAARKPAEFRGVLAFGRAWVN